MNRKYLSFLLNIENGKVLNIKYLNMFSGIKLFLKKFFLKLELLTIYNIFFAEMHVKISN